MNTQGKAIIFSAPSGAGKTTIVHALLETNLPLKFSISATSRSPRGSEKHANDYYFLGIDGFKRAVDQDKFLEWEEVYPDQFYGTLKSEVDRVWDEGYAVVFDVDVIGGMNLKETLGDKALSIFIKPPSIEELARRLQNRGTEDASALAARMQKHVKELAYADEFDAIIVNDDLEIAIMNAQEKIHSFLTKDE